MFRLMGARNPTQTYLLEYKFPIRLTVSGPDGHHDPIERDLRRVIGWQAYGIMGDHLYLTKIAHAAGFVCECNEARLEGEWPLRITIAFEKKQIMLIRDALRTIVGDAGYRLERTGHYRADRPAWYLELRTVYRGVQFTRMAHPALIVTEDLPYR